jgi:hypothetical protein
MSLSDPRIIFGVHSVTPYNRATGVFYGIFKVLGGSTLSLNGENIKLMGGSQKYAWAIEEGNITAELSLKPKEYPDFLFELFLGKAPTAVSTPDTAGTVSTLTNVHGTSIMSATTGIASVSVTASTGAANLKFGKYLIKYLSATTVDIFMSTDIDFNRGTDETYDNDLLRVATAQTITSGGDTTIASLGLTLTGGSGSIALVSGDTARFEVLPPATKSMSVTVGGASDSYPEFGAIIMAKQRSNGEMFEIDAFRCKAAGMPIGMEMNAFGEGEIKAELFYDSTKNGVFAIRWIQPS